MKRWRSWFAGALIAAALAGAVLHFGEIRKFADLARRMEPLGLLAALGLQLSTYASLAMGWLDVGVEAALSATLLLRVLILWLPLLPGLILARRLSRRPGAL